MDYEQQQKIDAMPRTMTISEIRGELDKLNIKYTFYDCYAGSNNSSFTIFNTQVICPVGYSLDNAIYATDKSNWFVLNKENVSTKALNDLIDYQGSGEFKEMNSLSDLINKEIKIHQAVDDYSQNIIHIINYHLARLLLRENITDKTFDEIPLKDYINNQKQIFQELLGERFTKYNENYVGELLMRKTPKIQQERTLSENPRELKQESIATIKRRHK